MRVVFQRVSQAAVRVEGEIVGEIGAGALLLLGIAPEDGPEELSWMVKKVLGLRVFQDQEGKMNRSLMETGGSLLVVSQFTLYGDCRKGRRPSFIGAAAPEKAKALYEEFMALCRQEGVTVESGVFGAMMDVEIHNQGPVTLLLEREAS